MRLLWLFRRPCYFAILILAAGVCAPACAGKGPQTPAPGKLTIGVGAPATSTNRSGLTFTIDALTKEPLLTMLPDGSQAPRLVREWTWDTPHTTLRLTLRPDVYFHNGAPLTAQVGAEAIRLSMANHDAFSLTSIRSVNAVDQHVLELKLSEVNSFILPDLALISLGHPAHPEVGTGPFQLATEGPEQIVFKAFDRYYRGRPGLDEIDLRRYPTQRNAWSALMRGDIDMLQEVSRDAADFVEAETTVTTYSVPRPYYIPLVFNLRHPVLRGIEVRRAINEALDREALVREGMSRRGSVADGPVWPLHWAYSRYPQPFQFDPENARRLLDGAGLKVRPGKGSVPMRFAFTCLVFADDSRFERLAMLIQKQLADVGIDMKIGTAGPASARRAPGHR